MDFAAYTEEALVTAKTSALKDSYLIPGIMAEFGEVVGHLSKFERDSDPDASNFREQGQEMAKKIGLELGDLLWMSAVLAHVHKVDPSTVDISDSMVEYGSRTHVLGSAMVDFSQVIVSIGKAVNDIFYATTEDVEEGDDADSHIGKKAVYLFEVVLASAPFVAQKSSDEVMYDNLFKLRSRAERGVIGGSGDDR